MGVGVMVESRQVKFSRRTNKKHQAEEINRKHCFMRLLLSNLLMYLASLAKLFSFGWSAMKMIYSRVLHGNPVDLHVTNIQSMKCDCHSIMFNLKHH